MPGHRNIYAISFSSIDASAVAQGVFEITPSTQSNVVLRELRLGKVAAAQSASAIETLPVTVYRGATDADAGGATAAAILMDARRGATNTFGVSIGASSPGSSEGGVAEKVFSQPWNTQEEFVWRPPKEERPVCILSQRLQVRLGAPAAAIVIGGTLIVEEIGKMPGVSDS